MPYTRLQKSQWFITPYERKVFALPPWECSHKIIVKCSCMPYHREHTIKTFASVCSFSRQILYPRMREINSGGKSTRRRRQWTNGTKMNEIPGIMRWYAKVTWYSKSHGIQSRGKQSHMWLFWVSRVRVVLSGTGSDAIVSAAAILNNRVLQTFQGREYLKKNKKSI